LLSFWSTSARLVPIIPAFQRLLDIRFEGLEFSLPAEAKAERGIEDRGRVERKA